jgi:hypothetical protein
MRATDRPPPPRARPGFRSVGREPVAGIGGLGWWRHARPVAGSPPARNLPRRNLTVPGRERWTTAGRSARPPCPATRPSSARAFAPGLCPLRKRKPGPLVPCCSCRAEPDDPPRHARVATRGLRAAPATGPHQPSDSCTKVHPIGTIAIMANRGGGGVSTKSGRTVSPPRPGCGWRAGPARGASFSFYLDACLPPAILASCPERARSP